MNSETSATADVRCYAASALLVNHSCIFTDSLPEKVSAPEKVSLCSQKPQSFESRK